MLDGGTCVRSELAVERARVEAGGLERFLDLEHLVAFHDGRSEAKNCGGRRSYGDCGSVRVLNAGNENPHVPAAIGK